MSRLQRVVLTIAALTVALHSCVPPWVEVVPIRGGGRPDLAQDAARLTVSRPLGTYPLWDPPTPERSRFVRVDYGRLTLYYLGTLALVVPFFVWRRRLPPASPGD